MEHLVLIGDVIASRAVANRNALQIRLQQAILLINSQRRDLSPFTMTVGDEFQVVAASAHGLFRAMFLMQHAAAPSRLRFGLGVGSLATAINPEAAIGMDGPAFHSARVAIEELKKSGRTYRLSPAHSLTGLEWMNPALDLLSHHVRRWQANRFAIAAAHALGEPAAAMASNCGISAVAVYKNIESGAIPTVSRLTQIIEAALDRLLSERS